MTAARPRAKTENRLPKDKPVTTRAALLAERLHLRGLYEAPQMLGPLVVAAGAQGLAVLFRYGAVVTFNLSDAEQRAFVAQLRDRLERPLRRAETEEATLLLAGKQPEGVTAEGIAVSDYGTARLQVLATVLARSVVLAYYESQLAAAFDRVEPLARDLEAARPGGRRMRELLRHIGGALHVQQRVIGRVEMQDKPELLWDHPELERLYLQLEKEYELGERNTVLERKLTLVNRTAETALNLLQNRGMLRVEWYIVILIVVEVLLTLYQMFGER